jgi:K+-transporting ATPase KdpF subunit
MTLELWIGGVLTLALFGYLVYVLIRPDRF